MSDRPVVDVRGECCPVPALRVEDHIKSGGRVAFTVLGDHRPTLESLPLLAVRLGWDCELKEDGNGGWLAEFTPR